MRSVCPGQDFRNLRVELYKCPNCSAEEKILSNETKAKCHECGEWIYKEKLPSCIGLVCFSSPVSGRGEMEGFEGLRVALTFR